MYAKCAVQAKTQRISSRNLSHGSVLKCVSSMKYVYLDPYQRYNGMASSVDRLKRCAMINIENENRIQLKSPHFVRLFFALMLSYSTHFFSLLEINAFYEEKIAKTKLLPKWVLSVVIFLDLKIQIAAPRFWNKQIKDDPKECWYDLIISITEKFNWIIKKMKNVLWPKSLLPFKREARLLEQVGHQYLLSSPDLNNRN